MQISDIKAGHVLIGVAILGLYAVTNLSHAADPMTSATGGSVAKSDRTFVEKAAIGGMTEVRMGQLAQQKGSSQAVKDFGAKMVRDHTKANEDLAKVAAAKGITVPGAIDKSHEKDIDDLAKKSGAEFDKAYVKGMVSDHKTDVSDFEKEAKSSKDADLQAFASRTLPTLQEHLKLIEGISGGMK